MLFCSYVFLLFLPITVAGYFLLMKWNDKAAKLFLVLASFYFYAYFNPYYMILLFTSLIFNFAIGRLLFWKRTRWLLFLGLIFNLGMLGYYKYYDFFVTSINEAFMLSIPVKHILLPLGISFFTFQQLAYLVDIYKGAFKQNYDPLTYALFVCFFPQLIAGPIVLPNEMMPQFENEKNHHVNWDHIAAGLFIFSLGLGKKILLADPFALIVKEFLGVNPICFLESWECSLASFLQTYFDFSGYCDMAIGIGLMFNIVLPVNFNAPLRSTSIKDFWKRWHITLGRFLMQYVYFPLGGSKKGRIRTYINLFFTFVLCGIWHGAGWLFILWGTMHGLGLCINRFWSNEMKKEMPDVLSLPLTQLFITFISGMAVSTNPDVIKNIYKGFFTFDIKLVSNYFQRGINTEHLLLFIAAFIICYILPTANSFREKFKATPAAILITLVLLIWSVFSFTKPSPFIYFNF